MSRPEYHQFEEFQNRTNKLKEIRNLGIDPYPYKYGPVHEMELLQEKWDKVSVGTYDDALAEKTKKVTVGGRLMLFRAMGKNAFGQLQDDSGHIQILFNRDQTKVTGLDESQEIKPLKFIEKKIDLGDILGIKGFLFHTNKGELTIFAKEVTLLCKALLPLPDKHSGITDKGTLYRKRWLDLIIHPKVRKTLQIRSKIVAAIRQYLHENNFIEVETPVLQNIYGGAEARPFVTEIHALHQKMYMRIALEISLKKLLVGGFSRIFELSKVFRNEGLDRTHNPEFTMLELYAAYWDYNDLMTFTEKLFEHIAYLLFGSTKIGKRIDKQGNEHELDLTAPWKRLTMKESIKTYANIDVNALSKEELLKILKKTTAYEDSLKTATRGTLIALIFEEFVEHHLIQPHHIIDHPIETTPLCKLHRDLESRKEKLVERFEIFILGYEFGNAYTELNDPELQRKLLEEQNIKCQKGDEGAHPMDEEFIEAICQGMPPTAGLGVGIDRLVMLFTNSLSIRDVIYFPIMRPED